MRYDPSSHCAFNSLACRLKEDDGCVMEHGKLRFGSFHKVISEVYIECLEQARSALNKARRYSTRVLVHALNEAQLVEEVGEWPL